MARKSFSTDSKTSADRKVIDFDLDGDTLYARRPKTNAFLALAEYQNNDDPYAQIRGVRTFMEECLIPDSRGIIQERLDDPDDDFDLDDIIPIINWLIEELSTRPTGRPTASSGRPRRTGNRSTARAHSEESIPESSPSTAS